MSTQTQQIENELLVLAAQEGKVGAFELLVKRMHAPLVGYANKVCGEHEMAIDVVQDVWIEVAKDIRKLQDVKGFRSWVYRKVRWRLIDAARKNKRLLEEPLSNESEAAVETVFEHDHSLLQAIDKLPSVEKQIIHLFYLDEMKITEISIVLEIPQGTVKSRLNRAREMLKTKFELE